MNLNNYYNKKNKKIQKNKNKNMKKKINLNAK